ncbi:hypothetical protein SCG7086_AC_00050 [Chlamydiales bacterium SCGC AG-110-P3]|nr:hypothetical protein SCG7086_AC_00050 [Chlamydiales bacterium SCGC AG-110-P3]
MYIYSFMLGLRQLVACAAKKYKIKAGEKLYALAHNNKD